MRLLRRLASSCRCTSRSSARRFRRARRCHSRRRLCDRACSRCARRQAVRAAGRGCAWSGTRGQRGARALAGRTRASLWRGRAYGELAYEDFARAESERLEEFRLVALESGSPLSSLSAGTMLSWVRRSASRTSTPSANARTSSRCSRSTAPGGRPSARSLHGRARALRRGARTRARAGTPGAAAAHPAAGRRARNQRGACLGRCASCLTEPARGPHARARRAAVAARPPRVAPDRPHRGGREQQDAPRTRGRARLGRHVCENGAVLVELAPLRDPDLVVSTIANALDIAIDPTEEPLRRARRGARTAGDSPRRR